jgi:hypothetical protein
MRSRAHLVIGIAVAAAIAIPAAATSHTRPVPITPAPPQVAVPRAATPDRATTTRSADVSDATTVSSRRYGTYGADISWPNCPKGMGIPSRRSTGEPMPTRAARFVIVGATNGPGFYPNPCLAMQLRWVHRHHRQLGAYAMTTYPRPKEIRRYGRSGPFGVSGRKALLRNTGYAEALFNARVMTKTGFHVPMIWVDVEPYPASPWSRHKLANRAVITGAIRGYRASGLRVGIYTNPNGWPAVVGAWQLPGYPTWATAGYSRPRHARAMCTIGPSGGTTWLVQWWRGHRDYDLICPNAPRRTRLFR